MRDFRYSAIDARGKVSRIRHWTGAANEIDSAQEPYIEFHSSLEITTGYLPSSCINSRLNSSKATGIPIAFLNLLIILKLRAAARKSTALAQNNTVTRPVGSSKPPGELLLPTQPP